MNKQQLIEDNMNLVYFLIHRYYPRYINDEDIVQCGMFGLCRAAETWDETKSKFSTYASRAILNEIGYEFKRRKKDFNNLSLDFPLCEESTLGDLIVGEEDVPFVDISAFYSELSPMERKCFDLLRVGMKPTEIAKELGISKQNFSYYARKLRIRWRNMYGN